jgi:hypothetical protein
VSVAAGSLLLAASERVERRSVRGSLLPRFSALPALLEHMLTFPMHSSIVTRLPVRLASASSLCSIVVHPRRAGRPVLEGLFLARGTFG